ncbi:CRISPR-associated endonuclease Cas2 [Rosettibacter firmus]|uniref:CRISPR-associated endonuclease Cas2 n=1 Tax=Rosettibacter firmus TaxID=3111522 RepID=UPI00336BEF6F
MNKILVTYDIPSDKRRKKICEIMKDYGNHVQYSVFECELTNKYLDIMKKRIKKFLREKEDSFRIYYLSSKEPVVIELGVDRIEKLDGVIII